MIQLELIKEDNILDSFKLKHELNPDIFDVTDDGYVLKTEVRKRLLLVSEKFIEFLGIEFFIHDCVLTGSLSNYNWSQFSDVDLHIIIDFEETKHDIPLLKEFFDAKKVIWNSQHNIKVKGFECEIYVQDIQEKHDSTGIYSVLNNKWIKKPERKHLKIDKLKIKEKVEQWMAVIDKLIEEKDEPNILERIQKVKDRLKKFRQCGLDIGGEYSYENLVFKYLRRTEYIKRLLDLKNEILDNNLSLSK